MFFSSKDYNTIVIEWNNKFPLDKWFREKYKISFNSIEHREISQIDIYFEWVEDRLFRKYSEDSEETKIREKEYLSGKVVKERQNKGLEEEFDNLDIKTLQTLSDKMNQ